MGFIPVRVSNYAGLSKMINAPAANVISKQGGAAGAQAVYPQTGGAQD